MRSESDGHAAATSWPGLAVWTTLRRGNPAPLVGTLRPLPPRVADFLEHLAEVRDRTKWDESVVLGRIRRVKPSKAASSSTVTGPFSTCSLRPGTQALRFPRSSPEMSEWFTPTSRTSMRMR